MAISLDLLLTLVVTPHFPKRDCLRYFGKICDHHGKTYAMVSCFLKTPQLKGCLTFNLTCPPSLEILLPSKGHRGQFSYCLSTGTHILAISLTHPEGGIASHTSSTMSPFSACTWAKAPRSRMRLKISYICEGKQTESRVCRVLLPATAQDTTLVHSL